MLDYNVRSMDNLLKLERQSQILNVRKEELYKYLEDCPTEVRYKKAVRHFYDAIYLR